MTNVTENTNEEMGIVLYASDSELDDIRGDLKSKGKTKETEEKSEEETKEVEEGQETLLHRKVVTELGKADPEDASKPSNSGNHVLSNKIEREKNRKGVVSTLKKEGEKALHQSLGKNWRHPDRIVYALSKDGKKAIYVKFVKDHENNIKAYDKARAEANEKDEKEFSDEELARKERKAVTSDRVKEYEANRAINQGKKKANQYTKEIKQTRLGTLIELIAEQHGENRTVAEEMVRENLKMERLSNKEKKKLRNMSGIKDEETRLIAKEILKIDEEVNPKNRTVSLGQQNTSTVELSDVQKVNSEKKAYQEEVSTLNANRKALQDARNSPQSDTQNTEEKSKIGRPNPGNDGR